MVTREKKLKAEESISSMHYDNQLYDYILSKIR